MKNINHKIEINKKQLLTLEMKKEMMKKEFNLK